MYVCTYAYTHVTHSRTGAHQRPATRNDTGKIRPNPRTRDGLCFRADDSKWYHTVPVEEGEGIPYQGYNMMMITRMWLEAEPDYFAQQGTQTDHLWYVAWQMSRIMVRRNQHWSGGN
jgi:hypothetical protein